MALGLPRLLRQLQISTKQSISTQSCIVKSRTDVFKTSLAVRITFKSINEGSPLNSIIAFTPQSINLNSNFPSSSINISKIIKCPILTNLEIIEPPKSINVEKVEDLPSKSIELPGLDEQVMEKQAARLLVIRKNKMKRHKLRKLRKRMKYVWAKLRQKREMRKEKAFQAELLAQIHKAEKFNAASYVAEKIQKSIEVPIPRFWKGKRLPEFIIRQKLGLDKK